MYRLKSILASIILISGLSGCGENKSISPQISSESLNAKAAQPSWWRPTPQKPISWHWQLSTNFFPVRDAREGVFVYDVDGELTTAAAIAALKSWGQARGENAIAICYIDVGSFEDYRSDVPEFIRAQNQYRRESGRPSAKLWGNSNGWDGSYYLDVRQTKYILPIMERRIKEWCVDKGFDALEPDETELYSNSTGFPLSKMQNQNYIRSIAEIAHKYGLSVGLKGNNGDAAELEPFHDWALTEQCFEYFECRNFTGSFVKNNKAVFNIEYDVDPKCAIASKVHINSAKRDLDLVGPKKRDYLFEPCLPDGTRGWE